MARPTTWRRISPDTLSAQYERTANGITYTATHYPSGTGMRGYWTVRDTTMDVDADNDWYCASFREVRGSVQAVVEQRAARTPADRLRAS